MRARQESRQTQLQLMSRGRDHEKGKGSVAGSTRAAQSESDESVRTVCDYQHISALPSHRCHARIAGLAQLRGGAWHTAKPPIAAYLRARAGGAASTGAEGT